MDADSRPPASQEGGRWKRVALTLDRPVECQVLTASLLLAGLVAALKGEGLVATVCVSVAIPAYVWGYEWAPAFGRRAYYRRVIRVWNDAESAREGIETRRDALTTERMRQLRTLEPPDYLRDSHRELVSLGGDPDTEPVRGWADSAGSALPWLERRAQLRAELTGVGAPPEHLRAAFEQAYANAVQRLFETSDDEYATVAKEGQLLLQKAIRKLRRMRTPAGVAEEHDHLVRALADYAAAEQGLSEAVLAADRSRLQENAEQLDGAVRLLDFWRERIATPMSG